MGFYRLGLLTPRLTPLRYGASDVLSGFTPLVNNPPPIEALISYALYCHHWGPPPGGESLGFAGRALCNGWRSGICEPSSSVSTVSDYRLDDRAIEVRSRQRQKYFSTVTTPALGPTQPPVQWVPAVLSPGIKRGWGRDADHSSPSSAEVENE
jgi:hypothetical protein